MMTRKQMQDYEKKKKIGDLRKRAEHDVAQSQVSQGGSYDLKLPHEELSKELTRKVLDFDDSPHNPVKNPSEAKSMRSKRSTSSSVTRRIQLKLEAAEAKAKIELDLVNKRLEASLAKIDAEENGSGVSSRHSSVSRRQARSSVEKWLEQNKAEVATNPDPYQPPPSPVPAPTAQSLAANSDIRLLAETLKDLMTNSHTQRDDRLLTRLATPRDLPVFSGDCIEWLHFKSAYYESTRICKYNDSENLWRLRKALRGEAMTAVTDLLIGNTPPALVMDALELRFGRPDTIIIKLTTQLKKLPPLPNDYYLNLFEFATKISNCVATIRALKQDDYLRSPELAAAIISKLPSTLISKWTDYAYVNLPEGYSKLELLSQFLKNEAQRLSIVGISAIAREQKKPEVNDPRHTNDSKPRTKQVFTTTATTYDSKIDKNNCKFCKKGAHSLPDCRSFKRAMRRDKWRFVKNHGLCYCCLAARHDKDNCSAPRCDVDNCGMLHHRMLHWVKPQNPQKPEETALAEQDANSSTSHSSETVAHIAYESDVKSASSCDVMLKVVRVKLYGSSGVVFTHALLDDASSISIMDAGLADQLGLATERSNGVKFVDAFGLEVYQSDAPKVSTQISGSDGIKYDIRLRKISKLNLPEQNLSVINNLTCKHLLHLKDMVCKERVIPRILIGEDNYHLIAPLEIIHGNKNEPYATYCRLGWSIHGYCGRAHISGTHVSKNIFNLSHSESSLDINELNELIRNSFKLDSIGISTLGRENTAHTRALQIMDDTARNVGNQWEVGLPFKKDNMLMPTSYDQAYLRLKCLLNKFQKDSVYADRYKAEIDKLLDSGYARKLRDDELSVSCTWYLPHFGVQNPNKPGKLRLVFDAAGKAEGMCLNDYLLTGPDLYNSLFGIMLRFRENKVVIIGDIKDMFLRIKIRQQDQNVLRFLWQENQNSEIQVFVMQSLIFGATCSPFVAQYIKNKNALKYEDMYPEAVHVIVKNHYMDDCLHSCESENKAIQLISQITNIHKNGGFDIRRWASNSKTVLNSLPPDSLAQSAIEFTNGGAKTTERTLGLMWHPTDDTFGFRISLDRIPKPILDGIEPPTKAKMLSIIMSVYDIHGFLSPFLIKSKIILQNVHRSGVDWNCHIQPSEHDMWVKWLDDLKRLDLLRIPRWYDNAGTWAEISLPNFVSNTHQPTIIDTQMHIFCDASLKAYAAVVYWRRVRSDGYVQVSFVSSKSRVTPLKPVSIPRLELQGALLAARLAQTVQSEQDGIQPSKRYFWTDSTTVLQWIRSDPRNYKPYVAHRLGEIDELSVVSEWRYVPTALNVADIATRDDAPPLTFNDAWFQGPTFLRHTETAWPKDLKCCKTDEEAECEVKSVHVVTSREIHSCLPNEDNISSWMVLVSCTARILFLFRKRKRNAKKHIDVELMREAEDLLLKKAQHDNFHAEIACLQENKTLMSNSRLLKLSPYINESGLLCVGGRIDKVAGVSCTTTRPTILDGKHRITRLLVEYYHRRALHGANEMVVNELRQRYWVIKLRPTVRAVASRCLFCRYRRASPRPQRMADLPAARLQHNRRPFSFTGVDFFGPIEVTVGRRRQKRYGVLFTCLTIRAIHIEVTENLTTDSTIMALRRMCARRGTPMILYSDNGTNLRGADNELKRSLEELNSDALREDGLVRGIEWRFIPPGAPEMGGAWERMVRTVKTALKVILKERAPHSETLITLLAEVEALVNSRPITHVSTEPSYPEALTPNHFLIGTSSNGPVFGKYTNDDLCLRKQWRVAQRLSDLFWNRWLKEYLPTLLPRQKWNREERAFKVGDYVILVEPNLERGCWRHGVVSAIHSGHDGRVRVVDVRTRTGVLRRPVTRVALLTPVDCSDDSNM